MQESWKAEFFALQDRTEEVEKQLVSQRIDKLDRLAEGARRCRGEGIQVNKITDASFVLRTGTT